MGDPRFCTPTRPDSALFERTESVPETTTGEPDGFTDATWVGPSDRAVFPIPVFGEIGCGLNETTSRKSAGLTPDDISLANRALPMLLRKPLAARQGRLCWWCVWRTSKSMRIVHQHRQHTKALVHLRNFA